MTTPQHLLPALLVPLVAWRIYRRVRRNVGRQPLRPRRLQFSIGIFSAVVTVFLLVGLRTPPALGAMALGLGLSVPIALYGLKLTRFEAGPAGRFYTPNTALGVGISVLFLGRLAYRFMTAMTAPGHGSAAAVPAPSPLTFFLFGLSAGYFIAYQAGVLARSRTPLVRSS